MAGIRLEFAQFGDFDSFDVIRSTSSMSGIADVDLPSPIATGLTTMYYVDTTVVINATYYYRIRVWRNGVSKVSSEIKAVVQASDPYWSNVVSLMHFDNNLIDETGKTWTTSGSGLSFEPSGSGFGQRLIKDDNTQSYIDSGIKADFEHDDFTIEFKCFIPASSAKQYVWLVTTDTTFGTRGWQIVYGYIEASFFFTSSRAGSAITLPAPQPAGSDYHVAVTRQGDTFRLFIDGVLIGEVTSHNTMSSGNNLFIGAAASNVATYCGFALDELRITRGTARYTANFTPPDAPFPSH